MKDIKSYVIGFLTCCCLFLIMGQGSMGFTANGKYQAFADEKQEYLIDTTNGAMWEKKYTDDDLIWSKLIHQVNN